MDRLTVTVQVKAVNAAGKVTFNNVLELGEMKLSDAIKTEMAVGEAVRAIGVEELKKAEAEEAKAG